MPLVVIADAQDKVQAALTPVRAPHGGARTVIPAAATVQCKPKPRH